MCNVLHYLHSNDIIHRDVHPTRFNCVGGKAKFNFIGMPYNYKKLLKKENFSGHINYSPPELILEQMNFSDKVDIWSLGCCMYFLIVKKDPFEGKDPKTIKDNILKCNIDMKKVRSEPVIASLISACLIIEEESRPHAFELINYLNKLEKEVYGNIVSDETKDKNLKLKPGSFITMSPNTSGSFSQSFDNSFNNSFNNSISSDVNAPDYQKPPSQFMLNSKDKRTTYSNMKKGMKLNCKSKEFVKNSNLDSPMKPLNSSQNLDSKVKPYTKSQKGGSLVVPQPDRDNKLGSLNPVSERSQCNEEDIDENYATPNILKPLETSSNLVNEENFGICDKNQYSFHTFNSSHLKDDQSFIDSSFNTMLNLNAELNEETKGNLDQLKSDLEKNRLPSNYYKFRIIVPEKGELICKQHVIDLSSVKVISSTQNSLGKVFMPKKSYLEYLMGNTNIGEENTAEDSNTSINKFTPGSALGRVRVPSIHSSFEKTSESNTFDLEFKDGSSYHGQVIKHGYGTYKDSRGNVYEGNWHLDK